MGINGKSLVTWSRVGLSDASNTDANDVRNAISRAAQKTGVDFGYLFKQAKSESGLNPSAQAKSSSASGLFQFIDQSWLGAVKTYGAKHGMAWAADAIQRRSDGSWSVDPSMKQAVFALRNQPEASALMAGEFASDNAQGLQAALGRAPNGTDLYFAHFLGKEGATKFLKAADANPDASAASLLPREARSNRTIFYDAAGSARSLGDVYALMGRKLGNDSGSVPAMQPTGLDHLEYAQEVLDDGASGTSTSDILAMLGARRGINMLKPTPETAMLAYMMVSVPTDDDSDNTSAFSGLPGAAPFGS
jgi:hypothetical protein